ncbi:MAG: chemotaxis protein CheW, partial [Alphaproteobacteria bacterium]|nr:chemotaxis protein CheW [Alphaproteobacteria bacterium]
YSLIIDSVGDVMTLQNKDFEKTPITLDTIWQEISLGIYQLDEELLIILDVAKLLDTAQN